MIMTKDLTNNSSSESNIDINGNRNSKPPVQCAACRQSKVQYAARWVSKVACCRRLPLHAAYCILLCLHAAHGTGDTHQKKTETK